MSSSNWISFPGLGIESFEVNRVAFSIFGLDVMWYGVIIAFGVFCATLFGFHKCKDFGMTKDDLVDGILIILPISIIGCRFFYVLFNLDQFNSFLEMINIARGGLSIWGGIIFAFISMVIFCKIKKLDILNVLSLASIGFLIGQVIGRWGNFFNAEVYGKPTELPWGMSINGGTPVHPLFLYESLLNLLALAAVLLYIKFYRKKQKGDIFFFYIIWYGVIRSLLEELRPDQFVLKIGEIKTAQLFGFCAVITGIVCLAVRHRKNRYAAVTAYISDHDDGTYSNIIKPEKTATLLPDLEEKKESPAESETAEDSNKSQDDENKTKKDDENEQDN